MPGGSPFRRTDHDPFYGHAEITDELPLVAVMAGEHHARCARHLVKTVPLGISPTGGLVSGTFFGLFGLTNSNDGP